MPIESWRLRPVLGFNLNVEGPRRGTQQQQRPAREPTVADRSSGSLKVQFERQLTDSWISCCGDGSKTPTRESGIRVAEVDMVEGVKELRAELQLPRLGQSEVLVQTHVPVKIARTA